MTTIAAALAALDTADTAALEATAARIRTLIEQAPLPPEVEAAIRDGYAALGDEIAVAVRSSATAEDCGRHVVRRSAGHLPVGRRRRRGRRARAPLLGQPVLGAVAGLPRRRTRRRRAEIAMAVVVQEMVDARGARRGDDAATRQRRPHEVVRRRQLRAGRDARLRRRHARPLPGRQGAAARSSTPRSPTSTSSWSRTRTGPRGRARGLAERAAARLASSPTQLRAVAELAKRAERHFGCPQDVEWALTRRRVRAAAEPPGDGLGAPSPASPARTPSRHRGLAGARPTP